MPTMTQSPPEVLRRGGSNSEASLRFLHLVARVLLEYSAGAEGLSRRIDRLAKHLGVEVTTLVGYRDVTLVAADGRSFHARVPEHRLNVAVNLETLGVIEAVSADRIGLDEATRRLEAAERALPQFGRLLLAVLFGVAASALAWVLRADWGAIAVSGVSAGVGLIARRALARRHVLLFAQPFTAALIGALLGGLVIRLGWTQTPGLCLIVPALMLVPGAHLLNSVNDMLDNHMPTGLGRLGLSAGILIAAGLGVLLGKWLILGMMPAAATPSATVPLTLLLDVALAGLAACGFGAAFNAPWRVLWISIVGGMVGHGLRFVCLGEGVGLGISTLLACLAIGLISGIAADRRGLPFGALAFASAVPMMPGAFIYEGLAGAVTMSAMGKAVDPAVAAATLALFVKAAFVIGAMAIGLLGGSRLAGLASGKARRI
jgi:uncharacterized membrane protein YjjP (DUF1212 family)